ncbi:hypothetical protein GCM10008018_10910 [Paenibacillus marchantiophytorum]|uniref:Uncharacterized protein n=1 Tax=Paenibacillus marchantiophytorum TaxID=1619310 RepID=A0ABQ2BQH5_9BACL|nr:nicotianamine synthase family protein [Paenibacillus marchantiophytorum]GGI45201.1 hypothetical protein GCM10008018_10910 [Paenibacillus marchantiophytorum]
MKNYDAFLFALHKMESQLKQLTFYFHEGHDCMQLLQNKLDELCAFINNEEHIREWHLWSHNEEIRTQAQLLRASSIEALCHVEKYQSRRLHRGESQISDYIRNLSHSVINELNLLQIDRQSKVIFVGSGALPTSSLIIAEHTGAEVLCLDIDLEAVELGRHTARLSGLGGKITFTNTSLLELEFTRKATHVLIASLVSNKLELLEELKQVAPKSVRIMMRYGNGLKSLFNCPLEDDFSEEWTQGKISNPSQIYDILLMERAKQMGMGSGFWLSMYHK